MEYDVIVAGAGPGGCIAARNFARSGLKVGLFDAKAKDKVSNSIVVEGEKDTFEEVGTAIPSGDEIAYKSNRIRVFSKHYKEGFSVEGPHTVVAFYLDKVTQRLLAEAIEAGAKFHEKHKAIEPIVENQKVVGATFMAGRKKVNVKARLTMDATGFNAALVRNLDPTMGIHFTDRAEDHVWAENSVYNLKEKQAKEAIEKGLIEDSEVWTRIGLAGVYSTEFTHISLDEKKAYFLVGVKESQGKPVADEIFKAFKKRQGYFGKKLQGGGGMIRIRHTLNRLVTDGFMVIGEAACMVIPAHGSGVSSAMYAGHLASRVAAPVLKHREPTTAALWPYAWEYQTGRGAVLATLGVTRLYLDKLNEQDILDMLEVGLMDPEDLNSASIPRIPPVTMESLGRRIRGLTKCPHLAGRLLAMAVKLGTTKALYQRYPKQYDPAAFAKWCARERRIFGPLE